MESSLTTSDGRVVGLPLIAILVVGVSGPLALVEAVVVVVVAVVVVAVVALSGIGNLLLATKNSYN